MIEPLYHNKFFQLCSYLFKNRMYFVSFKEINVDPENYSFTTQT